MKVLIIEDEKAASKRLVQLLEQQDQSIEVLSVLDSVKTSVSWLQSHAAPELIFMDIQLADGLSFDIFKQIQVPSPLIFTTAYDQYAIRAFKVKSVDYLLKPIDPDELKVALAKFRNVFRTGHAALPDLQQIQQDIQSLTQQYKSRFVVKVGEHIKAFPVEQVLYFCSREKMTFMYTRDGRHYIIDFSLDQLEGLLNPLQFFRISRKYMVRIESIQDIVTYSSSRLRLIIQNSDVKDVLVSRERVAAFKQWLDQ